MPHRFSHQAGNRKGVWLKVLLIAMGCHLAPGAIAQDSSNDHMFRPAASARPYIDFDSRGFIIHGKRTFLVSAGIEYARVPRELWKDRLTRLRQAGFNCVEIYTFWNFHEPREGRFDFSGDHDLEAFLKLAQQTGLYVIARVGPYYCAEWDNGGYPLWLKFKPGLQVRVHNPVFEKYVGRFFDKLLPIIFRNQINHGGPVIMVQLENEHTAGWGTVMPNGYFGFLKNKALSLGLEVPWFFSGLHHGSDPAANGTCDDPLRPNPWFSSEFWAVWFSGYGSTFQDALEYEHRTWKILEKGGNGYNYYMAYGGSNFGYTNNDEDAASYDYGAAVGQGGDLRPLYFSIRRAAWFARAFAPILENSTDASERYKTLIADTAVHIYARQSPKGDIVFADNSSPSVVYTRLDLGEGRLFPQSGQLALPPQSVLPLLHGYPIREDLTLAWGLSKILGMVRGSGQTSLVTYGAAHSPAGLFFSTRGKVTLLKGRGAFVREKGGLRLLFSFSADDHPQEYAFRVHGHTMRILAVNEQMADRTWFVDRGHQKNIVFGPAYAEGFRGMGRNQYLITEHPWGQPDTAACLVFNQSGWQTWKPRSRVGPRADTLLDCTHWQYSTACSEAAPGYDDRHWKASTNPLQMGADGDLTAAAWYRTRIRIDTPGIYGLQLQGGDRAYCFVDGRLLLRGAFKDTEYLVELSAGDHTLAIFTAHDGRDKLAGFTGLIRDADAKGLSGEVRLAKGGHTMTTLNDWRFLRAASAAALQQGPPPDSLAGWIPYRIGKDAFNLQEGFGWFRTLLRELPPGTRQVRLDFKSVDEDATVFVNGVYRGRHQGWNSPFSVTIDRADTLKMPLHISVFVENHSNEGGIDQPVKAHALLASVPMGPWHMRGGGGTPVWKPGRPEGDYAGPCYYRAEFSVPGSPGGGMVYRVRTRSLGHGSVWVNGHNLGRYPEKIPVDGLYIPPCWMKRGLNKLLIFEEDGSYPDGVVIAAELPACRETSVVIPIPGSR